MKTPSLLLAALLICFGSAHAQQAGSWSGSLGLTKLVPDVSSGDLTTPSFSGTKIDVDSSTALTGALNYALNGNMGLHIPLSFGFKHKVSGAGSIAGAGVIATTKALPITLVSQYRFMPTDAAFRPYVGAGLTYAHFYDETGTGKLTALTNPGGAATTLEFKGKLAPTVQLGGVYHLNAKWFIDANYTKTLLKTQATLSTGQTIDVKLNPSSYSLQVGMRF